MALTTHGGLPIHHVQPSETKLLLQRLLEKVEERGECWIFTGSPHGAGYGHMYVRRGVWMPAHRIAYECLVGPIPTDLYLDHVCSVRLCVRPAHLQPVTPSENMRRAHVDTTHCPNGHEYTPENLLRNCRQCHADRERARKRRASGRCAGCSHGGHGAEACDETVAIVGGPCRCPGRFKTLAEAGARLRGAA